MRDGLNLFAVVKNGKLEISNKESLKDWVKGIPEGSNIVVKFRKEDDYYSLRQLKLIYGMFRAISMETGYNVKEVKTMMKMYHGYCYSHEIEGKEITECKSLSDFNKKELSAFIEQVDLWSAQTLGTKLLTSDDLSFLSELK